MESIPRDPYLEFNPNTLQALREEFNLHQPGAMEGVIKNFQEWIDKQNHFVKKDFSKHFLEVSIILAKGSLERAKKSLDKLCTLKTLIPKFFSKCDAKKELIDLSTFMMPVLLPKLTPDNYRILIAQVTSTDIDSAMFSDYYRFITMVFEYMKAHDYTHGFVFTMDARSINVVNLAMKLNVIDLRNLMAIMMEGYGARVRGIHILSESKAIDTLVTVFKQILSQKLASRIKVHKTLDTLYEHIPKHLLPEDFGGEEKPMKAIYYKTVELFSTKDNVEYFKEICQPGTDEACRHTATYNEEILGMPGSFRALKVD